MFLRERKKFCYQLMKDKKWIMTHIAQCAKTNLSKRTFLEKILPYIAYARDQPKNEQYLESQIAWLAEQNLRASNDIANTINCITNNVAHEAKNKGLPNYKDFYLPCACALLGRFFSIMSSETGYISFK